MLISGSAVVVLKNFAVSIYVSRRMCNAGIDRAGEMAHSQVTKPDTEGGVSLPPPISGHLLSSFSSIFYSPPPLWPELQHI